MLFQTRRDDTDAGSNMHMGAWVTRRSQASNGRILTSTLTLCKSRHRKVSTENLSTGSRSPRPTGWPRMGCKRSGVTTSERVILKSTGVSLWN